ncbi:AI-2E family transporter, partial [Acinetobacter baumannii]
WPDYTHIAVVLGIFFVGQILEGYVLTPRLVGSRIGLHPVWVMFALLAGGALFGFVGMLLSLPMFAVVAVLARFALNQYLASAVYRG